MLEVVQQSVYSRSEKTNRMSGFFAVGQCLRHFEAFERDNVRIVFFPPNCRSWKQPYDMGIIVALKKRFKYLYLKDVFYFYELDEEAKLQKKM
jgi:hypothetical protein